MLLWGIEHLEIHMSLKGSTLRERLTPALPEMLERLKNWHVFSMSGSRQPTEDPPTNSDSAPKPSPDSRPKPKS